MADPQHAGGSARDPKGILERTAPPPARTTAYGRDPAQVYDVRLPGGAVEDTGVVVVHGGFWRERFDRTHAGCQAQAFADAGWPVAVVEYRRTGMPGGGWPGTGADVAAAVAALRDDPDLPDRLVLVGHSAGGHLVAWAASQPWGAGLSGVVSLAGVVDLAAAFEQRLGDGAVEAFMGGTPPALPEAYAAADPCLHVPLAPVALVHGADDDVVPAEISRSYAQQVGGAAGAARVTLDVVAGCEHFGLIDPEHPAFAEVLAAVSRLAS
jgi:acetyl esterase/lipase